MAGNSTNWLWAELKKLPALPNRMAERQQQGLLGEEMLLLTKFLPSYDELKSYYQAGTPVERRNALGGLDTIAIKQFLRKLDASVAGNVTHPKVLESMRVCIARVVGIGNDVEGLRKECRRLYLNQHPDKVGEIDYGSVLRNNDSKVLYNLLNTIKSILGDLQLRTLLYPAPHAAPEPTWDRWFFGAAGVAIFFVWRRCVNAVKSVGAWIVSIRAGHRKETARS